MTFDLDLWHTTAWRYEGSHNYINKPSLVQIQLQLFRWGHFHIFSLSYNLTSDDLWPWFMIFDHMNIWRFPYYINKLSLVPTGFPTFQMRPLSHFQPILQVDLRWLLTLVYDLWPHQKWSANYILHSTQSVFFFVLSFFSFSDGWSFFKWWLKR